MLVQAWLAGCVVMHAEVVRCHAVNENGDKPCTVQQRQIYMESRVGRVKFFIANMPCCVFEIAFVCVCLLYELKVNTCVFVQ